MCFSSTTLIYLRSAFVDILALGKLRFSLYTCGASPHTHTLCTLHDHCVTNYSVICISQVVDLGVQDLV